MSGKEAGSGVGGGGGGSDEGKNVSFAMARGLDAMQFAESRVQEIKALLRTLKGSDRVRRVVRVKNVL